MAREWTNVERVWLETMLRRYGNISHISSEELERRLEEVRRVAEDPFVGLDEPEWKAR